MTVSSTSRVAGPYNGNDATTAFPFAFKVFSKQDIEITHEDADGVQTVLTLDSDYSVSLNADQDNNPGGSITYPLTGDPLPTGERLFCVSAVAYMQTAAITNLGNFQPRVHENAFDRFVILIQQLLEKVNRAIKLPVGDTASTTLPSAAARAGGAIVFDDDGNVGVSLDIGANLAAIESNAAAAAASEAAAAASATAADASADAAADSAAIAGAVVLGNFLQAGTGAVSRTYSAKVRELGFSAKDFGAVGDGTSHPVSQWLSGGSRDRGYANLAAIQAVYPHVTALTDEIDWAAAQAAVNAAIYNGSALTSNGLKAKVRLTAGAYVMNKPLHLGYGTSFTSVFLEGEGPQYAAQTTFSGTSITFTHNDAPGIVVQGSRLPIIRGLSIKGANYNYISSNGKGTAGGTDSDLTASTWVDPALPANSSTRYAVYAGIAIDPYSGAQPATSYPAVSYPSFLGAVSQYNKNYSSAVTLEDVHIQGFVVGVAVQPCDADGNGDYTKLNRVWINNCQYGVSIGQSQSRLLHINDSNFANVHTAIVTTKHGRQSGKPSILVESTEFNALIQWVDIPNLSYGAGPRFVGCYGELVYSIGTAGANASANTGIVFESCEFSFQLQSYRGMPAYIFTFNGPGNAAFRNCLFGGGSNNHYPFFGFNGAKNYTFDGCTTDMTQISALYEKFSAQATAGITVSTLDTDFPTFNVRPSIMWNLDTGAAVTTRSLVKRNPGVRTACLPVVTRTAYANSYASDPGASVVIRTTFFSKSGKVFSTVGRDVTFDTGLGASAWAIAQRGLGVGDLLWDDVSGATFRVRSRTAGSITIQAISGFDSAGNLLTAMSASGTFYCLNCRVYTPSSPLMVDTTASNATASNVDDGNGSAAFINTDIAVNDYVYYAEAGDTVGGENALQITARDGTARTITMNGVFRRTSTFRRLPLFIRAEAPNG